MFNWNRVLTGNKVRRTFRETVESLNLDTDADTFEKEFTRLYEADTSRPRKEREISSEEIDAVKASIEEGDYGPLRMLYKSAKGREDLIQRVREAGFLS